MKIVSYTKVVPGARPNPEKISIIKKFVKGVNVIGDEGIISDSNIPIDCDVAVIQGWQHQVGKDLPHLQLRQKLIDRVKNRHIISADSNLFFYRQKTNQPHCYLRYSFNGVFPNTGNYCDTKIDPVRWQKISKDLDIKLSKCKSNGKQIVLCCQRNGGWSMGKQTVYEWVINTIKSIQKYTDRPIVIRAHPGDKNANQYLKQLHSLHMQNVIISEHQTPLEQDLNNAWAVVNHNSSSIVGPIIMGYHAFVTDAIRSQCAEVANNNFANIENPNQYNRELWLQRLSMFHWNFEELENGACWNHMREFIK